MKALCWHGPKDIRCDHVPDPRIEHPRDAIVKVTSCASYQAGRVAREATKERRM